MEPHPKSLKPSISHLNVCLTEDLMKVHRHYFELSDAQKLQMEANELQYNKRATLPTDPQDPMFYHIYKNTLPLEQAYRIRDPRHQNRRSSAKDTKAKRYVYEGWNNYS